MSLINTGINNVRAFEIPAGVKSDGVAFNCPRLAVVKWKSSWQDKFHLVFVNGKFAGSTINSSQRQLLIHLPNSFNCAVSIEVFAVEPKFAFKDFSSEIQLQENSGRVKIKILRSLNLPANSIANIYYDSGTGQIDFENPINKFPIRIWPAWQNKCGFGADEFGNSDFGYETASALGFGFGIFGQCQFGFDSDAIDWLSEPLASGIYKFAVKIFDENQNQIAFAETEQITVIAPAKPARQLQIDSFNEQLTLKIIN